MSEENRTKLRDFIKSVPLPQVARAMNAVCGSLLMQCTTEQVEMAIEVAREEINKPERAYTKEA